MSEDLAENARESGRDFEGCDLGGLSGFGDFGAIIRDFPQFRFVSGRKFAFKPPKTIVVPDALEERENACKLNFLHEIGHALLKHRDFRLDVTRVKMEVDAWSEARKLAEKYGIEFDEEYADEAIETYRDWLHKRSKCPYCGATRAQLKRDAKYYCFECGEVQDGDPTLIPGMF